MMTIVRYIGYWGIVCWNDSGKRYMALGQAHVAFPCPVVAIVIWLSDPVPNSMRKSHAHRCGKLQHLHKDDVADARNSSLTPMAPSGILV